MITTDWVWYFAYGSNMNPRRLFSDRLGAAGVPHGSRIAGVLEDWALCFNLPASRARGAGYANIIETPGAITPGTLNEMPPEGLRVLDRYEGVVTGHYQRVPVQVRIADGSVVPAIAYVARNRLREGLRPARAYLDHLLHGDDLLPAEHMAMLRAMDCIG